MNLNESDFRTLLDTVQDTVVAFFGASWCGPCRAFTKIFEKVSEQYNGGGVTLVKLDVDECTRLCEDLNVSVVPTLIVFKDSKVVHRQSGGFPDEKAFKKFVEKFSV